MTIHIKKNTFVTLVVLAAALGLAYLAGTQVRRSAAELSGPVSKGTIIESIYGIGTITANRTFQFRIGTSNTLEGLFIKEGDAVKKGDKLVRLDGDLTILAPFEGTVTALPFKIGENIFPQAVVVEVVDLQDRYLVVSLEQRGALRVRRGNKAKLSFDGLRGETFEGTVDSVYSRGNDFLVRVDVASLPERILPGMTADTAIGISEPREALLVPVAALDNGHVRTQRQGPRQKVPVTIGIVDGEVAEVLSGDVREGDRLYIPRKSRP